MTDEVNVNHIPEWERKEAILQKILDDSNGFYKQIVYVSNDKHDCSPELTTDKMESNEYPHVVERPTGMTHPKYEWTRPAHWVEVNAQSQGQRIAALEDAQKSLDESAKKLAQDHSATVQANQTLTTQINGLQKLTVQTNANVAQMMSMMNQLTKSQPDKKEEGTN